MLQHVLATDGSFLNDCSYCFFFLFFSTMDFMFFMSLRRSCAFLRSSEQISRPVQMSGTLAHCFSWWLEFTEKNVEWRSSMMKWSASLELNGDLVAFFFFFLNYLKYKKITFFQAHQIINSSLIINQSYKLIK